VLWGRPPYGSSVNRRLYAAVSAEVWSVFLFYFGLNFAYIWNYPLCMSALKLAPAKYAANAFSSDIHIRKISRCGSSSPDNAELGRFTLFAEDGKEMYKESYRTCTAIVLLIKPFVWRRPRCRCRCRRVLRKLPTMFIKTSSWWLTRFFS